MNTSSEVGKVFSRISIGMLSGATEDLHVVILKNFTAFLYTFARGCRYKPVGFSVMEVQVKQVTLMYGDIVLLPYHVLEVQGLDSDGVYIVDSIFGPRVPRVKFVP